MNRKTCIITGINGQDATILSRILYDKGWTIYGTIRPTTNNNFWRLEEQFNNYKECMDIIECDMTDCSGIFKLVNDIKPEWFINLAAISAVGTSFENPLITAKTDAMGPLYCLEAIRQTSRDSRFYQSSTSEMIANSKNIDGFADETTNMIPASPYAAAKLFAHHLTRIYREAYNIFACSSVLYNHSSKFRGEYFVERKICKYVAELSLDINQDYLYLGNVNASRDIGHAKDYMLGVYKMLKHDKPDDYTLCTGASYSIKEILDTAFSYINKDWKDYVRINPKFFRPCEVHHLQGSYQKAFNVLGWEPKYTLEDIIQEIINADISRIKKNFSLDKTKYLTYNHIPIALLT